MASAAATSAMPPDFANGVSSAATTSTRSGLDCSTSITGAAPGTRRPREPFGGTCSMSRPSRLTTSASSTGSPGSRPRSLNGTDRNNGSCASHSASGVARVGGSATRASVTWAPRPRGSIRITCDGSKPKSAAAAAASGSSRLPSRSPSPETPLKYSHRLMSCDSSSAAVRAVSMRTYSRSASLP